MATLEVKTFNYLAWLTGIAVVVFLAAAVYALVTGLITFTEFANYVGPPVSALVGWAARGAVSGGGA